jgi:large subunit ribosomal protein L1
MKKGKRYKSFSEKVNPDNEYPLADAVNFLKDNSRVKFDETVECAIRLGIDPKKSDQGVRSTVVLPHGTGKTTRVLVLTKGDKEQEAKEAGADYVGSAEYIDKIQQGWFDFDALIATPDMMKDIGKLGKVLGPKGLMPNPKSGTVTTEVGKMVKSLKAGRVEFRNDKMGNVHVVIGKVSFTAEALVDNAQTIIGSLLQSRPASLKGQYVKNITLSSTMGVGIKIDGLSVGVK